MSAAATGPPAQPGSDGGNPSCGGANSAPQNPGQDPGSSHPQHPVFARPLFYIHAPPPPPPPPPFLQYQWPMPFPYNPPYNPFPGFPGMSYGMVVPPPPLPAPPFMEPPAYFLPHPHMQPVDYRRLLHQQVYTQGGSHQNQNPPRRVRPPPSVPVRETVNTEVQTDPTQQGASVYDVGWQAAGSDSGRGTAPSSPCSTGSGSQKRASVEVESYKLPDGDAKDGRVDEPCASSTGKRGFDKYPAADLCTRAAREMQMEKEPPVLPPCRDGPMWVSSPDGILPVCSSSQKEDGGFKERRVSVPDILMGWGGDVPQAELKATDGGLQDKPQQDDRSLAGIQESIYRSLVKNVSDEDAMLFKILRMPYAFIGPFSGSRGDGEPAESTRRDELQESPNPSQKLPENFTGADPLEDETEILPGDETEILPGDETEILPGDGTEILPGDETKIVRCDGTEIVPGDGTEILPGDETKIVRCDGTEILPGEGSEIVPGDGTLLDDEILPCKVRLSSSQVKRLNESVWSVESLAAFVPSRDWLLQNSVFEPKVDEMMEEEEDVGPSTQKGIAAECQTTCGTSGSAPSSGSWLHFQTRDEKQSGDPGTRERNKSPSEKDPSTPPSPLEEPASPPAEEGKGSSEPEEETFLLNSAAEVQDHRGLLPVPTAAAEVSPLRGHLVDCAVQCNSLREHKCWCELNCNTEHGRKSSKDWKKANQHEAAGMTGSYQKRRNYQGRNRAQERLDGQQEAYNGNFKPGKSKGGNGRHTRY